MTDFRFDLNDPRFDLDKAYATENLNKVLIAQGAPLFNKLADLSDAYTALTSDNEAAIKELIATSDDETIVKARKRVADLTAQIEKLNAQLREFAESKLAASTADGKSAEDVKKEFQDASAAMKEVTSAVDGFVLMRHLTKVQEDGKRARYESTGTPDGDAFVKFLSAPTLSSGKSNVNADWGKRVRTWWESDTTGKLPEYKKGGRLPEDVKNAYIAANPSDLPKAGNE